MEHQVLHETEQHHHHQGVDASPRNGSDHKEQIVVPLHEITILSSLAASLSMGDFDVQGNSKKGAPSTIMRPPRRFHFHSSLDYMGRGLETISEHTESVFDPIQESSERRWESSHTNLSNEHARATCTCGKDDVAVVQSMRLVAPRRLDSDYDTKEEDEENDDINDSQKCDDEDLQSCASSIASLCSEDEDLDFEDDIDFDDLHWRKAK